MDLNKNTFNFILQKYNALFKYVSRFVILTKHIPYLFYFSGVHEDYHKSTDTIEKIEFEKLCDRTRLVFYTAWHLANQDDRPKLNEGVE